METIDYEELLKDQGPSPATIDQYKRASRLRDAARNLETLHQLVDAEAKGRKPDAPEQDGNEG
jgi:hypothetical protein